jgi:uncharacterized damage-inducible protein DinB
MSIQHGILIELKKETENTRRILNNLKDEHWDYKPHEKSMSLGGLVTHIVELHNWIHSAITKDIYDFQVDYQPRKPSTLEELKLELEENLKKNTEFINSKTEDFWTSNWKLQAGNHTLAEMPKIGAYRFIITNHLIHHRGQLTVYMRLLNLPLPGIYGPSADEK